MNSNIYTNIEVHILRSNMNSIHERHVSSQEKPRSMNHNVTKRNFLWLGDTITNSMTPKINLSQYTRVVSKSNTKGYRIIPCSGQLK